MSLEDLKCRISSCSQCQRVKDFGSKPVLASGRKSKLMLVGLAPSVYGGMKTGIPFTGKTSWVLDDFLKVVGLSRDEVFITNLVKCALPGNDVPLSEEIESCRSFLDDEISEVSPKAVVAFGQIVSKHVLKMENISFSGGEYVVFGGNGSGLIHVFPCPHPSSCARFKENYDVAMKIAGGVHSFLLKNGGSLEAKK